MATKHDNWLDKTSEEEADEGGLLSGFELSRGYLVENLKGPLTSDAMDYIAEYMSSWRDEHAQAKLARQFLALAESCTQAAIEQEARDALEGPDHE